VLPFWNDIHMARKYSQVTFHFTEIKENTMKDNVIFYFDKLPLNFNFNILKKWIDHINMEGKHSSASDLEWNHVARNDSQVFFSFISIQGHTMKDTVFFYFNYFFVSFSWNSCTKAHIKLISQNENSIF